MSRRGTTLIESVVSIFIISVVLVTFLEALNVGMTGTLQLTRKTSALNLAKSQIENAKSQTYNVSTGNLSNVYSLITTGENISDKINYNISGIVSNVSANQPLQVITVNVSYLYGKQVQLACYKTSDGSLIEPEPRGLLVTDNIKNVPTLPQGYSFLCAGQYKGFYHVFTTGTAGAISMSWKFDWDRVSSTDSMGAPMMAIYGPNTSTGEAPNWASRDYLNVIREDGIVVRNQNKGITWLPGVIGIGDLPGPGGGGTGSMCYCCDNGENYCSGESDPIAYAPHHCTDIIGWLACFLGGYTGTYPCCGACYTQDSTGSSFWSYDRSLSTRSGTLEYTLKTTGNVSPGTYTVLFFNGENGINFDTTSASVTYWK